MTTGDYAAHIPQRTHISFGTILKNLYHNFTFKHTSTCIKLENENLFRSF